MSKNFSPLVCPPFKELSQKTNSTSFTYTSLVRTECEIIKRNPKKSRVGMYNKQNLKYTKRAQQNI